MTIPLQCASVYDSQEVFVWSDRLLDLGKPLQIMSESSACCRWTFNRRRRRYLVMFYTLLPWNFNFILLVCCIVILAQVSTVKIEIKTDSVYHKNLPSSSSPPQRNFRLLNPTDRTYHRDCETTNGRTRAS